MGGVGKDLSKLRPRGTKVSNAALTSTGAASFMEVDSAITKEVAQGGRRGALMLSMDIRHPDILEFITAKRDKTKVTAANISVRVTDEFMTAVKKDDDFILRWPIDSTIDDCQVKNIPYNTLKSGWDSNGDVVYFKKVKAKEIWDIFVQCNWESAEPGLLFLDSHIQNSPDGVYPEYQGVTTNPSNQAA